MRRRALHLEWRLVPNVDFDDALQALGFYSNQILSDLGWVQFLDEVGVSTHK
jgi:hypothetical protein